MSKITSELLQKLAPSTPKAKRDRFLPFLNEACPRYGINTELRLAAFLATICFESAYFRATKEGRASRGKAKTYQDKYWGTGFYGRGLIQTTHRDNYVIFSKGMAKKGITDDPMLFVDNPELLEQPKWAVESACFYWESNNLNKYADAGKFFAIQGLVNKGNPNKEALEYPTREALYNTALRYMPNDFKLDAEEKEIETETPKIEEGQSIEQPIDDYPLDPKPGEPAPNESAKAGEPVVGGRPGDEPKEVGKVEPKETSGIGTWIANLRAQAVTSGITLASLGSMFTGLVTNPIFIWILCGVIALSIIAGVLIYLRSMNLKHQEKIERERQAFELTKLQAEKAADPTKYNIKVV